MIVELYCIVRNEQEILPLMVEFYRKRIPGIKFNIFDNFSSDNTKKISLELGCVVQDFDTDGEIRDDLLLEFKNNIWKQSKADLVIVIDCDEWVDFDISMYQEGVWYRSTGYNMVSGSMGAYYPMQDKVCVFDPKINEVNYAPGAHLARPGGYMHPYSPNLYHMKYAWGSDKVITRYKECAPRLSKFNKETGYGYHYTFDENTIKREYLDFKLRANDICDNLL